MQDVQEDADTNVLVTETQREVLMLVERYAEKTCRGLARVRRSVVDAEKRMEQGALPSNSLSADILGQAQSDLVQHNAALQALINVAAGIRPRLVQEAFERGVAKAQR